MTASRARFTLRYVFAHVEFLRAVRYEPDGDISVEFVNGSVFNLTEIAEALGAQAPFLVADIRLIAPHVALEDNRTLAKAPAHANAPLVNCEVDACDPEPLHLPQQHARGPLLHHRAG